MRVESDKPTRNSGWLHQLSEPIKPYAAVRSVRPAIPETCIDVESLWARWSINDDALEAFAIALGVDTDALRLIGCKWAEGRNAWAFPMKDENKKLIGIRLRNGEGAKWAVKGSHSGLFIPSDYPFVIDKTLYIVEGPTDLAAAMTLGLYSIGRAACQGQEEMILRFIRNQQVSRVVIVTDNDEPGIRGAQKLQAMLPVLSCIWAPPTKDIREFLELGGTLRIIEASLKDIVWTAPRRVAA